MWLDSKVSKSIFLYVIIYLDWDSNIKFNVDSITVGGYRTFYN